MEKQKNEKVDTGWIEYYDKTRESAVLNMVILASFLTKNKDNALDIGAGSLRDTRFLLDDGFKHVSVLDGNPLLQSEVDRIDEGEKITVHNELFEKFNFPENKYDLVISILSLPFIKPEDFNGVFYKIKKSLKRDGVLCVTLAGKNQSNQIMTGGTRHDRKDVEDLLEGMKIVSIEEVNNIEKTVVGGKDVNVHRFNIVARKL